MFTRKLLVCAGILLGLFAGSAQAASATGAVGWYFIQEYSAGQSYTFVNIGPGTMVCYYIGTNTAYATIFAAKQISGMPVTVSCDTANKITGVTN
jgi:hypothetical protein